MEKTAEFRTHDFYQACVLKTLGFKLLRLERTNSKFVDFIFDDSEYKAGLIIEKYWSRETQVVARDLIENINELKSRLYSN